jgi:hypothetical protein
MSGHIQLGPKLRAYLMWGQVPLRMAPLGRPSWLRYQRLRILSYKLRRRV